MSDEPIVEQQVEPQRAEVSPQAEETAPAPDQSQPGPVETEGSTPSPLEPGGERFKQVWARAKSAEAERDAAKEQLQREREERIRYEERLKAQEEAKAQAQPEYTWEQLEGFIAEGRLSRAQANEYKEKQIERRAEEKAVKRLKDELQQTSQESTVLSEIDRYKKAVPDILQSGSESRQKVEREYAYMVNVLKFPPTHATELAATRAALGDLDTVERSVQAKRSASKESFMETHSSTQKPQPKGKDPINDLTPREKEHYQKMIDRGRYAGWEEVRKELSWERPSLRYSRV